MAELTYREAVAWGIAQEMRRDPNLVMLGEDIAAAGGVFKTTVGLLDEFGPERIRDTPISEQAIIGAAMGAAMTGIPVIAEIMFSDFLAVCWDMIANEIAKSRYMTDGQVSFPLVIRTANGGGVRFGAQHSQSVENWAMMIPGLKVVAPSTPVDVIGLMAASAWLISRAAQHPPILYLTVAIVAVRAFGIGRAVLRLRVLPQDGTPAWVTVQARGSVQDAHVTFDTLSARSPESLVAAKGTIPLPPGGGRPLDLSGLDFHLTADPLALRDLRLLKPDLHRPGIDVLKHQHPGQAREHASTIGGRRPVAR